MSEAPVLRAGRDEDAEGFISLIGDCWAEYPGNILDVDGELPELRALASYFAKAGGMLWAVEKDGAVVGTVTICPIGTEFAEICRPGELEFRFLAVHPGHQREGKIGRAHV